MFTFLTIKLYTQVFLHFYVYEYQFPEVYLKKKHSCYEHIDSIQNVHAKDSREETGSAHMHWCMDTFKLSYMKTQ